MTTEEESKNLHKKRVMRRNTKSFQETARDCESSLERRKAATGRECFGFPTYQNWGKIKKVFSFLNKHKYE